MEGPTVSKLKAIDNMTQSPKRFTYLSVFIVLFWVSHAMAVLAGQPPQTIVDVRANQLINLQTLEKRLAAYQLILLGELHDNAHHHIARAQLIEALGQTRHNHAAFNLVVEQLARGSQIHAKEATASGTAHSEPPLIDRLNIAGFQEKAWRWPLHEPVFNAAIAQGMTIYGGNLARGQSMQLYKHGEAALPNALQGFLQKAPLNRAEEEALNTALFEGHCGQLPSAMLEPMRLIQRATDLSILVTATEHLPAIIIAGNGHVQKDFGIPTLAPAMTQLPRLVTVGFLEEESPEGAVLKSRALTQGLSPEWAVFDYVWLTPPAQREDPCKDFHMPKR